MVQLDLVLYLMLQINHVKEQIIKLNNVNKYNVKMHQIIMILMKNVINLKKDVELQVMDVQI